MFGAARSDHDDEELRALGLSGRARFARVAPGLFAVIASAVVHALVLGTLATDSTPAAEEPRVRFARFVSIDDTLERTGRRLVAQRKRRALIEEARATRARGELDLGDFLLRANAIDAEQEGVRFDLANARRRYEERLAKLQAELAGNPPEVAVPLVFDDISYTGTPGGRMGDTLSTRRGSCEPVSHLVAASLHDAGLGDRARLRFYGGALDGVTHVTPVLTVASALEGETEEIDLMTGGRSEPGGSAFVASQLIEAYARAHMLEADVSSTVTRGVALGETRGLVDARAVPATRTLSRGYPQNTDRFGGALPLFADRAIAAVRGEDRGRSSDERPDAPPCSFYLSLAWLDLPSADLLGKSAGVDVDLVRAPSFVELERLSTLVLQTERIGSTEGLPDRLLRGACLAALYDHAGLLFSLAGQSDVSVRAVEEAKRARRDGAAALAELHAQPAVDRSKTLADLDQLSVGRSWVLLFLEGGEEPVEELARDGTIRYGRTMALTAMLVAPRTRQDAVLLADTLSLDAQVELMHELTHAHDHARPWAASYALDLRGRPEAARTRFARNYRVFHGLAWRLWDAGRAPEDTVEALAREATEQDLDEDSRRAIGLYYLKHYFRLYRTREGGADLVARALDALAAHDLPGLDDLATSSELSPAERGLLDVARSPTRTP